MAKRKPKSADEIACEARVAAIAERDLELSKKLDREPWEKTTVEIAQSNLDVIGVNVAEYRKLVQLHSRGVCGAKEPFVAALNQQLHSNPKYKSLLDALQREERERLEALPSAGGVQ